MAEYSRFFGGPAGAIPEYTQPQFAEVLEKIFTNGVFSDIDDELAVSENDPVSLSVIVAAGEAWINGFWYQNTANLVKTLGAADPDNGRIDRIILRLDTTTEFKISCEVLEGTPAADPDPPELTQTAAIYEISLAQVLVAEDATSVSDEDITDEREFVTVPGTASEDEITEESTVTTTIASSATPTPARASKKTRYVITALAEATTFGAPTGTPVDGDLLWIRIKDNGTARALDWNAIYVAKGVDKPTTTTISKELNILYSYNSADSKWGCISVAEEA